MLFTIHNRAAEARRMDAFLHDPDCVRIYDSIDYDFARNFGKPDTSPPMRSRIFDDVVRPWMASHPGGTVVELGSGLKTQFQRCDDGRVQWLCVDLPEALAVRERFLSPSARCRYVAKSALDFSWFDEVDPACGVFVSAQGLFMYFNEAFHRIQSTEVVLPIAGQAGRELRIRCVVRPDPQHAVLLDHLGLRLPERIRIPLRTSV